MNYESPVVQHIKKIHKQWCQKFVVVNLQNSSTKSRKTEENEKILLWTQCRWSADKKVVKPICP